jgi:aspartokinase-like uncharacterized kinase
MTFVAEVRKVQARKTISNDIEYEVVLRTSDITALSLGAIPGDKTVRVVIEPNQEDS